MLLFANQQSTIQSPYEEEGENEIEDIEDEFTTPKEKTNLKLDFNTNSLKGDVKFAYQFENYTEVHQEYFSPPPEFI